MVNDEKIRGLLQALKQLGGYFVWQADGEEYVLISKKEFDVLKKPVTEIQLGFSVPEETESKLREEAAYLDQVNKQLADQYEEDEADMLDDIDEIEDEPAGEGMRKKVRFEPIRGDLPPDLQE